MKRITIFLITFLLLISSISLLFLYKNNYNYLKNEKIDVSSNLAINVYDDDLDRYIEKNSVPTGRYKLNFSLSHCENNGTINNYNYETGSVNISAIGTEKCHLYFDRVAVKYVFDGNVDNIEVGDLVTFDDGTGASNKHNGEEFYVIAINGEELSLMSHYMLIDDSINGGYKQGTANQGKIVAYGSNVWTNTGGTYSGDVALSYINSIGATPSGNNGVPTITQLCTFTGSCGVHGESNDDPLTYSVVPSASLSSANTLQALLLNPGYTSPLYGYWTSSASSASAMWGVNDSSNNFSSIAFSNATNYGVRPVFNISILEIKPLRYKLNNPSVAGQVTVGDLITFDDGTGANNKHNGEEFYVMALNGNDLTLMSHYMLIDDSVNGGYKQGAVNQGKTVAYGSNVWTNTGGTYSGDVALSYINSIGATPSGKNGVPTITQLCTFTESCGAFTESNQGTTTYARVPSTSLSTSNTLQSILLNPGYLSPLYGYWTSSAYSSSSVYRVYISSRYFSSTSYSNSTAYGVRPIFNISLLDEGVLIM